MDSAIKKDKCCLFTSSAVLCLLVDVTGVACVVTGAASGLGAATVTALLQAGARVVALDRDPVAARPGVLGLECDVTSPEAVEAAFASGVAEFGVPRVLVNCAGVSGTGRVVERDGTPLSMERFERVVRINLFGTFNTIRIAASQLTVVEPLESGERGVIVNTSSVAAFDGMSGGAGYSASKGGVAAMSLPLARELGPLGIRVLDIAPGLFLTGLTSHFPDDTIAMLAAEAPFPTRPGDPSEYADLVLAIIGNPMLNGTTIRLDAAGRPREPDRRARP
jgi:NAD(P)-dependent dehydrogenase (short-subunit alcohol dehydrogenase family)